VVEGFNSPQFQPLSIYPNDFEKPEDYGRITAYIQKHSVGAIL
jgi:hypothetical protein